MGDDTYRQLFQDLVAPVAILDRDLAFVDASDLYVRTVGQSREALIGRNVFLTFPTNEDNVILLRRAWTEALAGKSSVLSQLHYPIPRSGAQAGEMEDRWWTVHSGPVRAGPAPHDMLVFRVEDMTERVRLENARELVTKELQHRMLNLTTLVGVIARQSAKGHESVATFVPAFLDRLTALARSSRLLVGETWAGLEMHDLVEDTLDAFNDGDRRITWTGPRVTLAAGAAQAIAMGLHELATNAVKYGALSTDGATVSVRWSVCADDTLSFVWQEDMPRTKAETRPDGRAPDPYAVARTGFGTTMLNRLLPLQLGGQARHGFVDGGMRYHLTAPVGQFGAVGPTAL